MLAGRRQGKGLNTGQVASTEMLVEWLWKGAGQRGQRLGAIPLICTHHQYILNINIL